jgi:hypothetical protein
VRINGNSTSANDDVPGFESLGEGCGQRQGQRGSGEQGLAHDDAPFVGMRLGAMVGAERWGFLIQLNEKRRLDCDETPGLLCVNSQMIMFLF